MTTLVTSWQEVIVVALNLGALCFVLWCINRPSK